jgi:hypothetical protein
LLPPNQPLHKYLDEKHGHLGALNSVILYRDLQRLDAREKESSAHKTPKITCFLYLFPGCWNLEPVPASVWNLRGSEDNKGVYGVFGVFIILGSALHELNNDLHSIIAKREKIDIDILAYYQSLESSVSAVIVLSYLPRQPLKYRPVYLSVLPFYLRLRLLKDQNIRLKEF